MQRIATYLVGEDPLRIEKHAGTLRYLWPYFGAAVWFVELALWDILGKAAGLPVYKLLGGARDEVPAYASTGQNRTPAQRADDCRRLQDEGYRAVKLRIHNDTLAEDLAQVKAVRKAVGDGMAIMVDANQADVSRRPAARPALDLPPRAPRPPRPSPSTASPGSRSPCRGTTTTTCAGSPPSRRRRSPAARTTSSCTTSSACCSTAAITSSSRT